jgi:hypothetical protein
MRYCGYLPGPPREFLGSRAKGNLAVLVQYQMKLFLLEILS